MSARGPLALGLAADDWTDAGDVERTKPEPDLVLDDPEGLNVA